MKMMLKTRSGNAQSMKSVNAAISACRHCRFYFSEGRRGGSCQQLGVPVQGSWKSCSLAVKPFASQWEDWSGIVSRHLVNADPQTAMAAELPLQTIALPEIEVSTTTSMIEEILSGVE